MFAVVFAGPAAYGADRILAVGNPRTRLESAVAVDVALGAVVVGGFAWLTGAGSLAFVLPMTVFAVVAVIVAWRARLGDATPEG